MQSENIYNKDDWNSRRFMSPKEFIENYVIVNGERIKLTPAQCAFLNWLEKCRKKQLLN